MNILILTDFSSTAKHAGKYAVDLFGETAVNFYLLNIQNLHFRGIPSPETLLELKKLSEEEIHNQAAELQVYSPQLLHNFYTIISEENLVAATRRYVNEKKIDLIVMGTSSSEINSKSILGKHTREIIQKIRCNVLAISERSKFQIPKKFVMPVDTSLNTESNMLWFLNGNIFNELACITVMEIGKSLKNIPNKNGFKSHFECEQKSYNYDHVEFKKAPILNEKLLEEIQDCYNMIVVLGKNLSVCNNLLRSYNGEWAAKTNKLPVLVLHEKF